MTHDHRPSSGNDVPFNKSSRVLIALPDHDFDTTEVAIPWQYLTAHGVEVTFCTEHGAVGQTDPLLLRGVLFGRLGARLFGLGAGDAAVAAYHQLEQDTSFCHPLRYAEIVPTDYAALILPGGHAKGMRQYLESSLLQEKVLDFWQRGILIGAICHGTIVLARTMNPATQQSVLYGRRLTGLTKSLEQAGFYVSVWRRGRYYRTYPAYVEDEVVAAIGPDGRFEHGNSRNQPFVVEDGHLITARWPGDALAFAQKIEQRLLATPGDGKSVVAEREQL